MASTALQVLIFAVIAVLVPLSLLIFSRLVRPRTRGDEVEASVYESAEQTVGSGVEIMHEYLHYFSMFLAFEVAGIILVIWASTSRQAQLASGWVIMLLVVFVMVFEMLAVGIARKSG